MLPESMATAGVTELRQYTLVPGTRQTLLDVFETHLVEPQEDVGMRVGGTFADRDDPDRFVWFRGFSDMAGRLRGLEAFYGGPVWAEHAATANATMLDSDDVLLLRPTDPPHPPAAAVERAPVGSSRWGDDWAVVEVWRHQPDPGLEQLLATVGHALLERAAGTEVATWRSETAVNDFPRLPVRAETVFVWSATFPDESSYAEARQRLESELAASGLLDQVERLQHLRLRPTPRSEHPSA
jgi:hypothetical protein